MVLSACSDRALDTEPSQAQERHHGPTDMTDASDRDEADASERFVDGLVEPPERAPGCDPADRAEEGARVPWSGFEHEGNAYTCNTCQNGLDDLQGGWRLIDFDTEDPDVRLSGGWRQTVHVEGNRWRQVARWSEGAGDEEATLAGWYWCGSKPEVTNEATVFVVDALEPSNAFGYTLGGVFTADLLSSTEGGDKLAFLFYEGFNTGDQLAEVYCRIGSSMTTLSGELKPCLDPFVP